MTEYKKYSHDGKYEYRCSSGKSHGSFFSDRKFDDTLAGAHTEFSRLPPCVKCGNFTMYAVNPDWEEELEIPDEPNLRLVV